MCKSNVIKDEWGNNLWYPTIYPTEYYLTIKMFELLIYAKTYMALKGLALNEK